MRLLLTLALIIWPSFTFAQIGNRTTNSDDLVSSSRLGKLAKKISDENSSTADPLPSQGQTLGQSGLQNNRQSPPITNPTPSLSSKSTTSGAYDLSAGQDRSLDIAGVVIGMSPDQVKQTLTAKGYRLEETKNGPSFEELVKIKREGINSKYGFTGAIQTLEFRKVFETIKVNFRSMPGHPVVSGLLYRNNDTALTPDKIRHLLMDKYGADQERIFKQKRMAGKSGILRAADQADLDRQKTFEWFNQGREQLIDGQLYLMKTRRTQVLEGSIPLNGSDRMTLTLTAAPDLETLQDEQIRSRFGASTTTF